MHRSLQFAGNYRLADFGNECATLAAVRQQLADLIGIAGGFELHDFDIDVGSGCGQAAGNFLGLGQRHDALARADPYSNCHHSRSLRGRAAIAANSEAFSKPEFSFPKCNLMVRETIGPTSLLTPQMIEGPAIRGTEPRR